MIEVRTRARLHLGLLDNNGGQGRLYGSIGVAVNEPCLVLTAESADKLVVEGLDQERATTYAQRFINRHGLPAGAHMKVIQSIPPHVGLGSGTQLGLAVGTALARLAGLQLSTSEIALSVERGMHSGIGIATFRHGGFVLDGGHRVAANAPDDLNGNGRQVERKNAPPVLFRCAVPKDWFFVTAIPGKDQGFSGEKESNAFLKLPRAPASVVEKISWLLLMKMLPALVEEDIVAFGQALTSIQWIVGDCFASVQGGRFAGPASEKLVYFMLERGAVGAGQSSWGPTVYGLIRGRRQARQLTHEAQILLASMQGGRVFCLHAHNRGAQVREYFGTNEQEAETRNTKYTS
jgi:beta-ribofuranosylaminobenzene 5'-phosphate synthase